MEVFFYGLFMDQEVLAEKGVNASNPRKGHLTNYTLKIGNRASLIRSENEKAYGIVMEIGDDDVVMLYAEKSVADYRPEKVEVVTDANEHLIATCFNLPIELLAGTNVSYAKSLYDLAKRLDFPQEYLDKIKESIP